MSDVIVIIGTVEPRHYEPLYEAFSNTSSTKPGLCKTTPRALTNMLHDAGLSPTHSNVATYELEIQDCLRGHVWARGFNIDDVKLVIITDEGLSSLTGTILYDSLLDLGGKNFPGRKALLVLRPEDNGWLDLEA